ncbi:MAG TPA: response regulator [Opitutus sp.]|nr:response regulator [Opitutus sp.]
MPHLRPVLIAEDNPNDVELILAALQEARLANEIAVAGDGVEALDFLHCRGAHAGRAPVEPAVILLDLKMPRIDGLEVLRQVRADPHLRHIPVVVLTSSREDQDLIRTYHHGVNAYVVKPVEFDEFISAVARLGVFWALLNEPPPASTLPA